MQVDERSVSLAASRPVYARMGFSSFLLVGCNELQLAIFGDGELGFTGYGRQGDGTMVGSNRCIRRHN